MKRWFTSDWHLGEDRLGIEDGKPNLFYRPFKSVEDQNHTILQGFVDSGFQDGDELWHLGDVVYKWNEFSSNPELNSEYLLGTFKKFYPSSTFNLIVGNYDEDKLDILGKYFNNIYADSSLNIGYDESKTVYLSHYPENCIEEMQYNIYDFYITGHIHGLWKVQRKMINVGVDAWHFRPVPEDVIEFAMVACEKHYDGNVFPY